METKLLIVISCLVLLLSACKTSPFKLEKDTVKEVFATIPNTQQYEEGQNTSIYLYCSFLETEPPICYFGDKQQIEAYQGEKNLQLAQNSLEQRLANEIITQIGFSNMEYFEEKQFKLYCTKSDGIIFICDLNAMGKLQVITLN